ncbi:dicarboxylate/amino acid:cation symporter, partial [Pseudoalteromonas piscicida]|uniref:cation:dicarboxylate symporter family transporter n=2 Tax=Pseudoalteromonas TaxID=53246 RepID=UPI00110BD5B7
MTSTTSINNNEPKKMALWLKILIGMIAGIIAGMLLGNNAEYIKPIGQLFISAIKMLIVPLIFCS